MEKYDLNYPKNKIQKIIKSKDLNKIINLIKFCNLNEFEENLGFNEIYKISKNKNFKKINLLIISNNTFQIFEEEIKRRFLLNKIKVDIFYKNFNELITTKKKNFSKKIDIVKIFLHTGDLKEISSFENTLNYKKNDIRSFVSFLNILISEIEKLNVSKIFINNLNKFNSSELGNYTRIFHQNKFNYIDILNKEILKIIDKKNIYLLDNDYLSNKFGLNNLEEINKYYLAKIPFTKDYAKYYFSIFSNLVSVSFGKIKKVLILDLDNTLWGGILGDDGANGIEIGPDTTVGRVFHDFQRVILNLKKRGVLLAICSKNTKKNVIDVFQKNKNLILKYSDFVCVKANFDNKGKNIKEISDFLGLSLDSFVFIDDSPVERDLVRNTLPEVSTPELPNDPSLFGKIILENYFFDVTTLTKEDTKRASTYISNTKRKELAKKFSNIDDYLKSLKMKAKIKDFSKQNIERIVQLFQRSNQFNLTTIRYSSKDIEKFINRNKVTFEISFKDCFSDYGIISLIVCEKKKDILFIENWVMSCRALNRSLENFILKKMIMFSKQKKINKIIGKFKSTKKNSIVKNLYDKLGFKLIKSNNLCKDYEYNVNKKNILKNFIEEIN